MRIVELIAIAIFAAVGIQACDANDGPAEETGQVLDEAGDNIQRAADDAADAAEEACEDAKDGVDAEDTDC